LNIGIVTTWFERGAALVSRAYFDALKDNHKVFVYARGGERYSRGDPKWDRPYVTWGKVAGGYMDNAINWDDFQSWIDRNRIELIIFNEQQRWDTIVKALKLNIVLGAYVDYYTVETYRFFWLYDFLLCNTKRHYELFKDHPCAIYIPWGTDLEVFKPRPRVQREREVVFFHSCGLSPYRKGTDIVVKAFRSVSGNARLVIHSQSSLQFQSSILSAVSNDARITPIEKEVGAPGLYYLGDVYVYPSRLDGIGLTIAEALASGLPVITTNAPPMNEFLVEDFNGKLVDVADSFRRSDAYYWPMTVCDERRLTQAMQFFVDNISDIGRFQLHARQYAEANLDWKKNSKLLANKIEYLSHQKRFDDELVQAVMRYDRFRIHHPPLLIPPRGLRLRLLMHKLGISRARRIFRKWHDS
jgi:glycosyltransferase involved in cell wall biosynthesis